MTQTQLKQAIKAIKTGDKKTGEQLLRQVLTTEPNNEVAWLWLATATELRSEKIRCLAKALEINPDSITAQQGIARLHAASPMVSSGTTSSAGSSALKHLKKEPQSQLTQDNVWLTWDEVWFSVVSRPSVATFERILTESQVSIGSAFTWLAISSMVAAALGFILTLIVERLTIGQVSQETVIALVVGVTVGPIAGVLGAALATGLTQWVASLLGGQGTFSRLLYAQAAYGAPLGIVIAALTPIPVLNWLNIILFVYAIVLNVLAIQAVNRFSPRRAIAAVLIPGIGLGLLTACSIFLLIYTLATATGWR